MPKRNDTRGPHKASRSDVWKALEAGELRAAIEYLYAMIEDLEQRDVVRAQLFELVDAKGRVIGSLGPIAEPSRQKGRAELQLRDEKGEDLVRISAYDQGGSVLVRRSNNEDAIAGVDVGQDGCRGGVFDFLDTKPVRKRKAS